MSNKQSMGKAFLEELEMESSATRKCLERIPANLFSWKPHDKSMKMGDLALTVSDIPGWIAMIVNDSEIDFATYERFIPKETDDLLKRFDSNMDAAKKALTGISDEEFEEMFSLKNKGQVLTSSTKKESVGSSINHLVHHRGQLTVYMRMNDIPVPSIYGPSGDDQSW